MSTSLNQKVYLGLAALLGMFYIAAGLGAAATGDFSSVSDRVIWASSASVSGAFILAGLLYSTRAPLLAGILVVVGAVPMGFYMWWAIFPPIVALVVAVFGVVRARGFARQRNTEAPALQGSPFVEA